MNDNNTDTRYFPAGKIFLLFLLLASLTGCSLLPSETTGELPPTSSYNPRVYIHPASADLSQATIAVPPFQIPTDLDTVKGEEVAALFQQTLLQEQVFHTVKIIPNHFGSIKEAVTFGREEGVDLVLAGQVNYALSGSSLGGGRLNISIRVIDLTSSNTVWFIEQTANQAMTYPDNSLLYRLSRILSPPPIPEENLAPAIPVMLARITLDMSRIIKAGQHPYPGSL